MILVVQTNLLYHPAPHYTTVPYGSMAVTVDDVPQIEDGVDLKNMRCVAYAGVLLHV